MNIDFDGGLTAAQLIASVKFVKSGVFSRYASDVENGTNTLESIAVNTSRVGCALTGIQ